MIKSFAYILIRNLIAWIIFLMIIMFVMLLFILVIDSFLIYVGFINLLMLFAHLIIKCMLSLLLIVVNGCLIDLWVDGNLG